jgi:hypothetical protein
MKRLTRCRPSPALAISLVALFVSLSGVSYGVATGFIDSREIKNNTVRSRDIRNSEVRGRDVRNSTLGGADVARDKLRGDDILESSLRTVPSANTANTANNALTANTAATATRATTAGAVDRLGISGSSVTTASIGQAPTLLNRGPFRVFLNCDSNAGSPRAQVLIATTEGGSAVEAAQPGTNDVDFNPGESQPLSTAPNLAAAAQATGANTYSAFAPSGLAIVGQVYAAVNKNGAACVGGATALG